MLKCPFGLITRKEHMKHSKVGRYFWKRQKHNNAVGDLARYINDKQPHLFAEPIESWDSFFERMTQDETNKEPADRLPTAVYNTYQRIRRMLTARSGYRVERPAFAAYMWRYRRYTGPTAELARRLYDEHPDLFTKDFDSWLLYMQNNEFADDQIDQLILAYRRSQRDPNDPDYSRYVNHRYNQPPETE